MKRQMTRIKRGIDSDIAALVTPLYAPRKEGISTFFSFTLFAAKPERVVQRSVDRVSQLWACYFSSKFGSCLLMGYYSLERVG
jgi:hypothetical protein